MPYGLGRDRSQWVGILLSMHISGENFGESFASHSVAWQQCIQSGYEVAGEWDTNRDKSVTKVLVVAKKITF